MWQIQMGKELARNERAEAMAVALGLVHLPFEVSYGCLYWTEYGSQHKAASKLSLVRLKEMVACVAMKIGPPVQIGEQASPWADLPTLIAKWEVPYPPELAKWQAETMIVSVSVSTPSGCKMDPRQPRIHTRAATL